MACTTPDKIAFDLAINIARQVLYRFGAVALLDPHAGSWERLDRLRRDGLVADAANLLRGNLVGRMDNLARGERPVMELDVANVFAMLPDTPGSLNDEYERAFGLLVSNACPPYETEYIGGKFTFQRSQALADISGFYRAFGLKPSDQLPERHDHVVLELEFMAFLIGLERQAVKGSEAASDERLRICRNAQTRFLHEHLAWWVPAFCQLLGKENRDGFYEAVGRFLAALVPAERSMLSVEAPQSVVAPGHVERPEQCEGCQLTL